MQPYLLRFLIAVFFAVISASAQAQWVEERLTVDGIVVDTERKPVADADVYIYRNPGFPAQKTDAEGKFTLSLTCFEIKAASVIMATVTDEAIGWAYLQYEEGSLDIPLVEIVVFAEMREFTGTVSDHEGNPVAGAFVGGARFGAAPFHCESDESGHFRFKYPTFTPVKFIYAVKPDKGFAYLKTEEYALNTNNPDELKVANQKYDLKLTEFVPLKFFVTNEDDVPIPNCRVQVDFLKNDEPEFDTTSNPFNFAAKTNDKGIAELVAVPKGWEQSSLFQVYRPFDPASDPNDWTLIRYGNFFGTLNQFEVIDGMYHVKLPRRVRIKGTVNKPDGGPAVLALVCFAVTEHYPFDADVTDRHGNFGFYMNPGYHAFFVVSRFGVAPAIFDIDPSETDRLDFQLQKGVEFSGTILDKENKPVPNMFITLCELNPNHEEGKVKGFVRTTLTSDEQGKFEFLFPPGSDYVLIFHKESPIQKSDSVRFIVPLDLDKMEKTYIYDETAGSIRCSDNVR